MASPFRCTPFHSFGGKTSTAACGAWHTSVMTRPKLQWWMWACRDKLDPSIVNHLVEVFYYISITHYVMQSLPSWPDDSHSTLLLVSAVHQRHSVRPGTYSKRAADDENRDGVTSAETSTFPTTSSPFLPLFCLSFRWLSKMFPPWCCWRGLSKSDCNGTLHWPTDIPEVCAD